MAGGQTEMDLAEMDQAATDQAATDQAAENMAAEDMAAQARAEDQAAEAMDLAAEARAEVTLVIVTPTMVALVMATLVGKKKIMTRMREVIQQDKGFYFSLSHRFI